jgi:acyl-CoA synthetase (NDP forming)/RimJ/RimL family protein N-acetyltransferase
VDPGYPSHWEADVVLRDGGTAHLRPIRPDDADRLRRFYSRLSDETIYFRFFSLYRELSQRDVERFTVVDHHDRAALVATIGDEMVGVVRYERLDDDTAEVAFNIEDAHQGRGIGSVFLEHIAAAARERAISRFVADVLPTNARMLRVFEEAGYVVDHEYEDGVARLEFDLEPTEDSLAVTYAREHRSEALSVRRLLDPRSVVVVGASREAESVGQTVLRHLVDAGFTGPLHAVNQHAAEIAGVRSYASVRDVPGDVDLVVVAVPAAQVETVVGDCAAKGVRGLVVMSTGFAETGEEGARRQRSLVALARGSGMRVLGPGSLGVINTAEATRLNASLSPLVPATGRVGFFSQSGALGVALLDSAVRRGLGLSTFVNAGNRIDVSGNDLLQFWEEDEATEAVMLYLESIGNPRKFSRIARRLSRQKPVVVVKSGRGDVPHGHLVRRTHAPAAAVDALFRRAGVIRVESIHQMFDVAQLVAHQPLPAGPRVAVVGNSDALAVLAVDAAEESGLQVVTTTTLGPDAGPDEFSAALSSAFADPEVESVVAVFIPPLLTRDAEVAEVLARAARDGGKTVVSTFLGMPGVPDALRVGDGERGSVPSYPTAEDAVRTLAAVTAYAAWRSTPAGHTVVPAGLDVRAARALVAELLGDADEVVVDDTALARLLSCYGIDVVEQPAPAVGVACRLSAVEDPLFGPVLSFGLGGLAADLLGDRSYGVPPLTDTDLSGMVRSVRMAPLLLGHGGGPVADLGALEDLLARLARLADDLPEMAEIELDPVIASPGGAAVLAASGRLARPAARTERGARALPG